MFKFLEISKQSITVIKNVIIRANAHFLTDTSQAWILSNIRAEEGVCEVFIHYISGENNKSMMTKQPLWKGYLSTEIHDSETQNILMSHIDQPFIHVIVNIHKNYKDMTGDVINFIHGTLRKSNPEIPEIIIDTFLYSEIYQHNPDNY